MMEIKNNIGRRSFLKLSATAGLAVMANNAFAASPFLKPYVVDNPLKSYPNRDWEKVYRDMFHVDSEFIFLCAPNDTHNCLLKAHVKNDVVIRISPSYGYGDAEDMDGNRSSHRWEPRICNKGMVMNRKAYSDRRPKGAMVRTGFKAWADAGYPRTGANGFPDQKYLQRGKEPFIKLPWTEAYALAAGALENIARTYSGDKGAALLTRQGYDPEMIASMHGCGIKTMKFRAGMAALGVLRIYSMKRFAQGLALLDAYVRNVGPDEASGAKVLDSYSWHTDLAPGCPMVSGHQMLDYEFMVYEHAKLIVFWGNNFVCTKMPDLHWVSESRLKGCHIVDISIDYHATSNKADDVIILRPGTDPALGLGVCHHLIKNNHYDENYLRANTDMPLLIRTDNWKNLKASDIIADYKLADLTHHLKVMKPGESPTMPPAFQSTAFVAEDIRKFWGDNVVWDKKTNKAVPLTRDECGARYAAKGVESALTGEYEVTLVDGKKIKVVPVFQLQKEYLEEFTPENTSIMTGVPVEAIVDLANLFHKHRGQGIISTGAGTNHYFNSTLKDRGFMLLSALSDNVGHIGGCTFGNYVGNYRQSVFGGFGQYLLEDPFNPELDGRKMVTKMAHYTDDESAHYYNYGDRPLRNGTRLLTDPGHMPAPTKVLWQANSNSSLGNAKGHYDMVVNTLPRWEAIFYSDWNWTASCEYSDIVWGVDSWLENKHTDMACSCSNPFLTVSPITPLRRFQDTVGDAEVPAGIFRAFTAMTGDQRFADFFKFVGTNPAGNPADRDSEVYGQRVLNAGSATRGMVFAEIREKAKRGIPSIFMSRTYPRISGWEQTAEGGGLPWYTKSGRLEFYMDDPRLIDGGENLTVYRTPIDSSHYEPNVIVGNSRAFALMETPEMRGLERMGNSLKIAENRQGRNVILTTKELMATNHPLRPHGYEFCFNSPKYRHGAHTTPIDTDLMTLWWGPFGDIYRHDKRQPSVGEGFVDVNPLDAKRFGIDEGDYIWVDADPGDRPYKGWKEGTPEYALARFMVRCRYFPGMSQGSMRMYYNAYAATYGSMEGARTRADGLAKSPRTNYQAMFRSGNHQSCTRAWINPTNTTDTVANKKVFGQEIIIGMQNDVHCANGSPKESYVKIELAEKGGVNGGVWHIAAKGYRPTYESLQMKTYLQGGFTSR